MGGAWRSDTMGFNQLGLCKKELLFQQFSFSFPIQFLVNFMKDIIQMEMILSTSAEVDMRCHVVTITFLSAGEDRPITDVCTYSIIIFIFSFYTDCSRGCAFKCQIPILEINFFSSTSLMYKQIQ